MLKLLRNKRIAKAIFWALVILIMPAFVLWGSGSLGRSKEKGPSCVGTADNKKVSFEDFAKSLTSVRCYVILDYFSQPQILDIFLKDKAFMARMAWDRIIMLRAAGKYKLKVSDKDVINYIKLHPMFVHNGRFDEKIYEYVLKNNMGLYPRNFEEIVRENLMIQRLNDLLTKDAKASDAEIIENYKKNNEKFKISYIAATVNDFLDKTDIGEDRMKDYYEKHRATFALPPKEGEEAGAPLRVAPFEDVKANVKTMLSEEDAKSLAIEYMNEEYKKIMDTMSQEKVPFEQAASKLGFKIQESPFFSKSDYLEGIGEALPIATVVAKLKKEEISAPIETRKGALVFKVLEIQNYDEEKFKKEKDKYSKDILAAKKSKIIGEWLKKAKQSANLNINLDDYEKYYR